MVVVLAGVAGAAILGKQPADRSVAEATAAPELNVDYVPRPSPWAVPRPTVDPATFEGASALARTEFLIPPPRWLASHRAATPPTARLGGLGWQVDPYMK